MHKYRVNHSRYTRLFLLGSLCGTVGALLSPLPPLLSGYMTGECSMSSALWRGLVPLLFPLAVGKVLLPAVVLLRACTVSWTLTLLLRAEQLRNAMFFSLSLLFLLPAFFLLAETESASLTRLGGSEKENYSSVLFSFLCWIIGSAVRFYLPHMI